MLLRSARYLARGTCKAVRQGDLFPASTRRRPSPAPGGSSERPLVRGPWELRRYAHTTHRLPVPGLIRELRILHLSDVHARERAPWQDDLARHLAGFRPDLVALTGDLVTRHWTEDAVRALLDALPDAPLGRWATLGNWEHWSGVDPERWRALLAEHDVHLLLDQSVDLGPVGLAGTDDLLAADPDVDRALADLPDKPAVVLSHCPALFPRLARPPVRLVLSGHAHGGQILLPGVGALFVPRGTGPHVAGWFRRGDAHLFVSRGVGWSLAPMRLNCPPELAEIILVPTRA